jgi:hypothetical protein
MKKPQFKVGDMIVWAGIIDKPLQIIRICGDEVEGYQYNLEMRGWYNVESVDRTAEKVTSSKI